MRASASKVEVWAPAKLNLFLEVLARRGDGFHEIETLMTPVSLFDTLYFDCGPTRKADSFSVTSQITDSGDGKSYAAKHSAPDHLTNEGLDHNTIPEGADNIVVRAVELLRQNAGVDRKAVVHLVKRIPTAAGLGGGSSDGAAALMAANAGWGLGYRREQLMPLAAQLGSDVPFFLADSAAVCRGRGEQVRPVGRLGSLHFVIARPPLGLSTAEVYGNCQVADAPRACDGLLAALRRGDLHQAGREMLNRLQPAAEKRSPWINRLKEEFQWLDLAGQQMSGSGTSYFGLCRDARQAARAAARLRSRGVGNVYVVRGL